MRDVAEVSDLATAVFALPENGITGVVKGADGTYRIGRVTQIVPQTVDPNYAQTIVNAAGLESAYADLKMNP